MILPSLLLNIFASINPAVAGGFEHQGYFALIDQNGFIRSRRDDYGNPIVYYMGIDQEEEIEQGVDQLLVDIEKLRRGAAFHLFAAHLCGH